MADGANNQDHKPAPHAAAAAVVEVHNLALGPPMSLVPPPEPSPPVFPPEAGTDKNYWARIAGEKTTPPPNQPDAGQGISDVLIVGAGLCGLTTALRFLHWADQMKVSPLPRVTLIDSALKIGGRTRSKAGWEAIAHSKPPVGHVSYGGTWVMLDNHELLSLSSELDWLPFQPALYPSLKNYGLNWKNLVLHPYLLIKIRTLGSVIWNAAPGSPEEAKYKPLDKISIEEWLETNSEGLMSPEHSKQAVRDWLYEIESIQTNRWISAWWSARTIYMRLSHIAQTGVILPKVMRWENGTGEIIDRLEQKLAKLGAQIYMDTRATAIAVQADNTVQVSVQVGPTQIARTYAARQVVVCVAPQVASGLTFTPPLPDYQIKFGKSMRLWDEAAVQVILAFKTQFWGKHGGELLPLPDDESPGVYGATMDLSDHGPADPNNYGAPRAPVGAGVLRILVKSARLKDPQGNLWSEERIKRSAFHYLENYARFSRSDMESQYLGIWIWNHEWNPDTLGTAFYGLTTGDYSDSILQCTKAYPTPSGPIHFGGSERAKLGAQWMEGAVLQGRKKAVELLRAIYPQQFTAAQHTAYKKYLSDHETRATTILRKHPAWGIGYALENLVNFIADTVYNIYHDITDRERWVGPPPKRDEKALDRLATKESPSHKIHKTILLEGEEIISPNGQFAFVLRDGYAALELLEHHKRTEVWRTASVPTHKPYRLVLTTHGELKLEGADGKLAWTSDTVVPEGNQRFRYELRVKDDRNIMLFGYEENNTRHVVWSSHTWSPFFANKTIMDEVHVLSSSPSVPKALKSMKERSQPFRSPSNDAELKIYNDMMAQHEHEQEYGRQHVLCGGRSSESDHPDRLGVGCEKSELVSRNGYYTLEVNSKGEIVGTEHRGLLHFNREFYRVAASNLGEVAGKHYVLTVSTQGALLVLHKHNHPSTEAPVQVWASHAAAPNTEARGPFALYMQDDRNIVIYDRKCRRVWSSSTYLKGDQLDQAHPDKEAK